MPLPLGRESTDGELYYLHVPTQQRRVQVPVDFLSVSQFLADELACKALWDLLTGTFKTRSKFLAIWPSVRFVAVHRQDGKLAGALLVSTPVNWQIDYVVVPAVHRGKGIATALVHETINQALSRKVPYVMLTSRASLRPLYEGVCGFQVVAKSMPSQPNGQSDSPLLAPGSLAFSSAVSDLAQR